MEAFRPSISPLAIEQTLQSFALADPRVKTFRMGDIWAGESMASDQYTLMLFELIGSHLSHREGDWATVYNVRLYVLDQRREDASNISFNYAHASNILTDLSIRLLMDEGLREAGWRWPEREVLSMTFSPLATDRDLLTMVTQEMSFSTPVQLCPLQLP